MRLSRVSRSHLREIEEACLFSEDDNGIAEYFRVPAYEVGAIRIALNERLEANPEEPEDEVKSASRRLRDAILGYFSTWEKQNGFRKGAGIILVPAGWSIANNI